MIPMLSQPSFAVAGPLSRDLGTAMRAGQISPGQLSLAYQPIKEVRTARIVGYEALARWNHPERGEIPPSTFIPAAESAGLIWELGAWVLRAACREAASWPGKARIAVNLAPGQLSQPGLDMLVESVLRVTGLDPSRLELEVSEQADGAAIGCGLVALERLRASGVRVVLDDFGVGHANFARLLDTPLDGIKLDRLFLPTAEASKRGRRVLRGILAIADDLGLDTVAEGVETEAQLDFLADGGCLFAQGYYLQRPMPAYMLA